MKPINTGISVLLVKRKILQKIAECYNKHSQLKGSGSFCFTLCAAAVHLHRDCCFLHEYLPGGQM